MGIQAVSSSSTCNHTSAPMTLDQLPTEILLEIFRQIPPPEFEKSLRAITITCVKLAELRYLFLHQLLSKWMSHPNDFISLIKKTSLNPFDLLNLWRHFEKKPFNILDIRFTIPEEVYLVVDEELLTSNEKKQLGLIFGVVRAVREIFHEKSSRDIEITYSMFPLSAPSRSIPGLVNVFTSIGSLYLKMFYKYNKYNSGRNRKLILPILFKFDTQINLNINRLSHSCAFLLLQLLIHTQQLSFLNKIQYETNMFPSFLPIHWSAICGSVEEIYDLRGYVNTRDWPPLFSAAMRSDPEIVTTLLNLGANHRVEIDGNFFSFGLTTPPKVDCTPLAVAVMCGNSEAARAILRHPENHFASFFAPFGILDHWHTLKERAIHVFNSIPPFMFALWNNDHLLIKEVLDSPTLTLRPEQLRSIIRFAINELCSAEALFSIVGACYERNRSWGTDGIDLELSNVMRYAVKIDAMECVEFLLRLGYSPNAPSLQFYPKLSPFNFLFPPPLVTPYSLAKSDRIKALMLHHGGTNVGLLAIKTSYIACLVLSVLFPFPFSFFPLIIHCTVIGSITQMPPQFYKET